MTGEAMKVHVTGPTCPGMLSLDAGETWFEENDPEGVAFEYEVLE